MRNRMFAVFMCFVALAVFAGAAGASAAFGAGAEGSINIKYVHKETAIPGAAFDLYKVAELSEDGEYIPTKEFSDYSVSLNVTKENERSIAITLAGYVSRDKIKASDTGKTGSSGEIKFENLTNGLYLVIGEECEYQGYTYTTEPFIVTIPDNEGNYDVNAEPKSSGTENTTATPTTKPSGGGSSSATNVSVMKIWKDSGNTDARPDSITVQLLRNGSVYKEVTLDKSNNWKYTWRGLSRSYTWTVVEKDVPDGYTVAVNKESTTYTVTNTYSDDKNTTDSTPKPGEGGKPTDNPDTPEREDLIGGPTDNPDTPEREDLMTPAPTGKTGGNSSGSNGSSGGRGKLPQTGQLWWPVPCAAILGMMLLLYAYGRFSKRRSDENE